MGHQWNNTGKYTLTFQSNGETKMTAQSECVYVFLFVFCLFVFLFFCLFFLVCFFFFFFVFCFFFLFFVFCFLQTGRPSKLIKMQIP